MPLQARTSKPLDIDLFVSLVAFHGILSELIPCNTYRPRK
jgi:hypothetical protein